MSASEKEGLTFGALLEEELRHYGDIPAGACPKSASQETVSSMIAGAQQTSTASRSTFLPLSGRRAGAGMAELRRPGD